MAVELNRIYQGRVNHVYIFDENQNQVSVDNGDDLLFVHHELYQDAINYYLVALAAMALDSKDSLFGKFKMQIRAVWNDFYRNGQLRPGLKHSLIRSLGHAAELNTSNGADIAMNLILEDGGIPSEILNAALEHLAEKCTGDVSQLGKTFFPRFCDTAYHGNWDVDAKSFSEKKGRQRLVDALYSLHPVQAVQELAPEIEIGWGGVKTQTGKFFTGDEAKASLKKAISYFLQDTGKNSPELQEYFSVAGKQPLEQYLGKIDTFPEISFGRISSHQNINISNAMWILKFFPDQYSVDLIKNLIPNKKYEIGIAPQWGDDPVKLSRGKRGYTFRAFTDLAMWEKNWKVFDRAAFSDALKTINQFRNKTQERNDQLKRYCAALNWMDGESSDKKPPVEPADADAVDEAATSVLPILAGDKRWNALLQLQKELGICNDFTENELMDYGLSLRTIRGYQKLRSMMLEKEEKMRAKTADDEEISQALQEIIIKFQSSHRDTIGSVSLFLKLAEPKYFCVWHDADKNQNFASVDMVADAVRYYSYQEEKARLEEPIQITPADARYSRRVSDLYALVYKNAKECKTGYGLRPDGNFVFEIAQKNAKGYAPAKVVLAFSAPRLKRDGLIDKEFSAYYPPVLQAFLREEEAPKQSFKTTAVILMPDWDKNGKRRILLNFPIKLDVSAIHQKTDHRFENQFYFANNTNTCLLWPSYQYKKPVTWYQGKKPFDVVAVDLGQRSAGAVSRITVSTEKREHSVAIGEAGGTQWYAYRKFSGLLRLPGEDATVIRDGQRTEELSGNAGRLSTEEETVQACVLCKMLIGDATLLGGSDEKTIRSFPKQNDKLLIAFRRATGRMKQLQRWLWMLNENGLCDKAKTEISNSDWLVNKNIDNVLKEEKQHREMLPAILLQIADRVLPLRGRKWDWVLNPQSNSFVLQQTAHGSGDPHKKICGQRGLSFARIEQLESLRMRCQALNRILMRKTGEKPATLAEMRNNPIPDCCPDILMRLDAMKEQRINQTANLILAQALGLRHCLHSESATKRKENGMHGEYEKIPGVEPAAFVVLEDLSRYRFSQDRSSYENSRLMKWSHRKILEKLALLCEVFNVPILQVGAAYSSKFSANAIPGFRAEECSIDQLSFYPWRELKDSREKALVEQIRKIGHRLLTFDAKATIIMPRNGGPVFIPFVPSDSKDTLIQADINASFNIGLRGVADATNLLCNNRVSCDRKKDCWQVKRSSNFSKMVYPEKLSLSFDPIKKQEGAGGNFFVLGCSERILTGTSEKSPVFTSSEMAKKYPNLMFGSALWRNEILKLERCCKINQSRLDKFIAKKEVQNEL